MYISVPGPCISNDTHNREPVCLFPIGFVPLNSEDDHSPSWLGQATATAYGRSREVRPYGTSNSYLPVSYQGRQISTRFSPRKRSPRKPEVLTLAGRRYSGAHQPDADPN